MTNDEAETMLTALSEHYRERVAPVSRYCDALRVWSEAGNEYWGADGRRAIRSVHMLLMKSSLAARLVYGGEKLRTRKCPLHNGVWSGIAECVHGCDSTGWLPESKEPTQ